MPKRSVEEKVERYKAKIRKLEEKKTRKRLRIILSDSDEDPGKNTQEVQVLTEIQSEMLDETPAPVELPAEMPPEQMSELSQELQVNSSEIPLGNDTEIIPIQMESYELAPEILSALGEATDSAPQFGQHIHENLSRLWLPILTRGLSKELRENLLKLYLIPENCKLLQAPKLNPEISAAISDLTRFKDKRVEEIQHQLGIGITALNRGITLLLNSESNKIEAIKLLGDSCRILCDLHNKETIARRKIVTPGLDKSFLTIIQDVDRDDMLFGNELPEKIKASKSIERQSLQIKKNGPKIIPQLPTSQNSQRNPGNWSGPSRFVTNRGGRSGQRKTQTQVNARKAHPLPLPPTTQSRTTSHYKTRARAQHH